MWELIVFALIILQCSAQKLIVELSTGKVQGKTLISTSRRNFYTWRHIPYAKPPLGELRFQHPVKPDPWTNILDGSEDSKACVPMGTYPGDPVATNGYSEDCLYVNVYSPVEPNSSLRLPVMFWIYGGQFVYGSGDFNYADPTPFLEEDVILITFNYRLGIFGFLSTEDKLLPGNVGLKDQVAALIWTRENIAQFGGNPLDITIFGNSAGAISAGYHLVSPMSRNLFTGAILQSGTSLLKFLQIDARNNAVSVARDVNSSISESSSSHEILQTLQTANADLLVSSTTKKRISFRPVVEVDNGSPFMTQPLYESIRAGNITKVPIIIGVNSEEGLIGIPSTELGELIAGFYDLFPSLLLPTITLKDNVSRNTVTQLIKQTFVGNGTFFNNLVQFVKWFSDSNFVRPSVKHAVLQSKYTSVYFYQFSFAGTLSKKRPVIPGCGRVGHADEVGYWFNISTKPIATDVDFLTRRRVVKLWTNFAKTKNPTPNDDSSELLQNVTWEPLDESNLQYLDIGDNLESKSKMEANMIAFWDYLWDTYSSHPYNTY